MPPPQASPAYGGRHPPPLLRSTPIFCILVTFCPTFLTAVQQDAPMKTIRWNMSPAEIEQESFRRIEAECDLHRTLSAPHWRVARRLIHTTADMHIADTLVFRHDPVAAGLAALRRKAPIFCDSRMLRSGLSLPRLRTLHPGYGPEDLHCYITDPDVVERARAEGHTRALCSAEKARPLLDGGIVLIGNAPLALARIARYILEEGVRPALVVGMPVGFVNVVESKELLARCPVPQIVLEGRRGGSALAVTTLHAVMESA